MSPKQSVTKAKPKAAARPAGTAATDGDQALGFALNFISGRAMLSVKERSFAGIELKTLELEIPHVSFPFDVTGGAERFKTRRCTLKYLVFSIDAAALEVMLTSAALAQNGFIEIKAIVREGYIELAGRFAIGEAQADFTMRAAPLVRSREELALVFYDTRVYGSLPVPASLLPVYLKRAINQDFIDAERAGMWLVRPAEQFVNRVLPQQGWKIPDMRKAQLTVAEAARGRLIIAVGPEGDPNPRQIAEREPPAAAVLASEGMLGFADGERAIGRGAITEAYELFREAVDDMRGGKWARERLLQIGAADPELAIETRQLADEALREDANDIQALLALAAIALRERSWGEAANRYSALAEIAHTRKERYDTVGAELAAAAAAAPVDPAGALAAYERAAARARDSVVVHQALFDLRTSMGDWEGATRAGDRLVHLLPEPAAQAKVHRQLGAIQRVHLRDLKQARVHFERSLRLVPDDPEALEGLAETYAARGEPARAASYLARLAEHAEASEDKGRIVALNLRLGEIWERWLSDVDAAAARYYRVLDVDPKNRPARLRLAALAEARGDVERARTLYEDILAAEETSGDPSVTADLVAAYTRLARVTISTSGVSAEAIACLDRAVELDPTNALARDELGKLLRAKHEWGRLIHLLEQAASVAKTAAEKRRARLEAAEIEANERHNSKAARRHLEAVLDAAADDDAGLEHLTTLLIAEKDTEALRQRLHAAAQTTLQPERRAALLLRMAQFQGEAAATQTLLQALDANPYLLAAAEALVQGCKTRGTPEQRAAAYLRLAVASPTRQASGAALQQRALVFARELGRPKDAESALEEASITDGTNVEVWRALAKMREDGGHLALARAALESAVAATSHDPKAAGPLEVQVANLAKRLGDTEGQVDHLSRAFALGAGDEALRGELAAGLTTLGKSARLAELFEEWAQQTAGEPGDTLRFDAAALREKVGENDKAKDLYEAIVEQKGPAARKAGQALERMASRAGDHAGAARALCQQIEVAPDGDHRELLGRLLNAQLAVPDRLAAETTCLRLLELDGRCAAAHLFLAARSEDTGDYREALDHWLAFLLDSSGATQERVERRRTFEHAAALAIEIDDKKLHRLRGAFDQEFPEAPTSALAQPLGEQLAALGHFEALLGLRRFQIQAAHGGGKSEWHRQAGDILSERLGKPSEAVPFYQVVMAMSPDDIEVRRRLVAIFDRLDKPADLARLLFGISQLAATPMLALESGLHCAEVFADRLADSGSAAQVLRALCTRLDIDASSPELHAALKKHSLGGELSQVLERSVAAAPDPDDGRFADLVTVLAHDLGDVSRAVTWCERMVEAFPESDSPRRLLAGLLTDHAEYGDELAVLRAWADARRAESRGLVLTELAGRLQALGQSDAALRTLEQAADANPHAEIVLTQLVDRYTAAGAFDKVVIWLGRLALAAPPGEAQDERWRRLFEVATDYACDRGAAITALESVSRRTVDETRLLGQLYIDSGVVDGLLALSRNADALGPDLLLRAGASFAERGRLDDARQFLEEALARGAGDAVWMIADRAFATAGRREELGRWRLKVAREHAGLESTILKLLGCGDIHAATGELPEGFAPPLIEKMVRDLTTSDPRQAWAAFAAARVLGDEPLFDLSLQSLFDTLADSDPRLVMVLRAATDHELERHRVEEAVALSERLVAIGDPEADEWLARALSAAGRHAELIDRLSARAKQGGAGAPNLWQRIAQLHADARRWPEAQQALEAVAPAARTRAWGQLGEAVAVARNDPARQVQAVLVTAAHAPSASERAVALRRAAEICWWRLNNRDQAHELLREAHAAAPLDIAAVRTTVSAALARRDATASRILAQALVVARGRDGAALRLLQSDLCLQQNDSKGALAALALVEDEAEGDVALLGELGERFFRQGDLQAALRVLSQVVRSDVAREPTYLTALRSTGRWADVCALLETQASRLDGPKAAALLEEAADLVVGHLSDVARALRLLELAARADPAPARLSKALELAVTAETPALIVTFAQALVERLAKSDPQRNVVLRALVDALEALQRGEEGLAAQAELLASGRATGSDKLHLARAWSKSDPARAAALLYEVASDGATIVAPPLLLEAAALSHATGATAHALEMLQAALAAGIDDIAAHELALELFEGEARRPSLARVIELGADVGWPDTRRGAARIELAQGALHDGDLSAARALLESAAPFGKPSAWLRVMEQTLEAQNEWEPLADLWLASLVDPKSGWSPAEQLERSQRAAQVYASSQRAVDEVRALEIQQRLTPNDPAVTERLSQLAAELGDEDRFLASVRQQLTETTDPVERIPRLLRACDVLIDRFEQPQGALALLLPEFRARPQLDVAGVIERIMTGLERSEELSELFVSAAAIAEAQIGCELLARAAGIAATAGKHAQAATLYRQVLASEPSHAAAFDFCLAEAKHAGRFTDALGMIEKAAPLSGGERGHALWVEAADVARDALHDAARETRALQAALAMHAEAPAVAARLVRLLLASKATDAAVVLITSGQLEGRDEEIAAGQAIEALRAGGHTAQAEQLMGWLEGRQPEGALAATYRLARLRREGNQRAVLDELSARLAAEPALPTSEAARLHAEAATAAADLGETATALVHLRAALSDPKASSDLIFQGFCLARTLNSEEATVDVVERAASLREQISTQALSANGETRVVWLELQGRVLEACGDEEGALGAFGEGLALAKGKLSLVAAAGLTRLLERRGDWKKLVEVYSTMAAAASGPNAHAELLYRAGLVYRDKICDEQKAEATLAEALAHDLQHSEAQLAYGLLLRARHQFAAALPYLQERVQPDEAATPIEHLVALLDCLRFTGDVRSALALCERIVELEPARLDSQVRLAELLEAADRLPEAEATWLRYIDALGAGADAETLVSVYRRLAQVAQRRDDPGSAIEHLEKAHRLRPESVELLTELRALYEAASRFGDAAALRLREASLATVPAEQLEHYRALAAIYRDKLSDPDRAAEILEKAAAIAPRDAALHEELAQIYENACNWPKYIAVGERLLPLLAPSAVKPEFLLRLAQAYEEAAGDLPHAKELCLRAFGLDKTQRTVRDSYKRLCLETEDFAAYVGIEEEDLGDDDAAPEQSARLEKLAEVYLKRLNNVDKGVQILVRLQKANPSDTGTQRRIADAYALEARSYGKAAEEYRKLLVENPLDADLLRILARLCGQVGDTDRAYGYYAALLALTPRDSEAARFVTACRSARPPGPQRALNDADRAQGLVHAGQARPIEELFTPLARFGELTRPGDLPRRGIATDRDVLAANDPRRQYLAHVLEPLGLREVNLYVWRSGGFACDLELVTPVALLLGAALADDPSERQRAFLVSRSAELYRSGHALCEKLSLTDLGGLVAALCVAVGQGEAPAGATGDTPRWAQIVAAPMTGQIRQMMQPKLAAYQQAAASIDLSEWRRACLCSATRTALLVSCDIEEALGAMLHLHGFEDIDDGQRAGVLQEAPEELDLIRFAVSEPYFKLRQALGLALRRSK